MYICLMINSFYRKQYSYLNFENNLCELVIAIKSKRYFQS